MGLYCNKTDLGKFFGMSRTKVYRVLDGLEDEIKAGRYGKYATAGNLINKAVVLDYMKYRDLLKEKNARKYAPPYDPHAAVRELGELEPPIIPDV